MSGKIYRFPNKLKGDEVEVLAKNFVSTLKKLLPYRDTSFSVYISYGGWNFFETQKTHIPMDISTILRLAKDDERAIVEAIKQLAERIEIDDY